MKVILIINGIDDLAKALAKRLTSKYRVIICTPHPVEQGVKTTQGVKCEGIAMDTTSLLNIESVLQKIMETYGSIDCLINGSYLVADTKLENSNEKEIKKLLEMNLLGPILVSKAVIPLMKKQAGGLIINMNLYSDFRSKNTGLINSLSNGTVTSFSRFLTKNLKKDSIPVTEILYEKVNRKLYTKDTLRKEALEIMYVERTVDTIELILSLSNGITIPRITIKNS